MRTLFRVILACSALAVFAPTRLPAQQPAQNETERLNQWFAARWQEQLEFSPIQKTFLGINDEDYGEIDDFSERGQETQLAWVRKAATEMQRMFNYSRLTPEAKLSFDIWNYQLERAEAGVPYRRRAYVFTQMQGPQAFLPQFLIAFHKVEQPKDMEAYIARIGGVARAIDQLLVRAKAAAAEGVRPPRFAYEGVLSQARGLVTGTPFQGSGESPVWTDAKSEIDALLKAGKIDEKSAEQLRASARSALVEKFGPAYDALIAWFEQDVKNTDAEARGVGALPQGTDFYKDRLVASTTTAMTADQIHEFGLEEIARIHGEMEAVKQKVGFKGTLQEFFTFMRTDPQFSLPEHGRGARALPAGGARSPQRHQGAAAEYFGILPKADLTVKRVEPFREQPGAAQHYFPGTPDGSRPGVYYAHLSDMKAMPTHELEVIAYHEGNPGHHMQIAIAQELTGVPTFRTQAGFTAYSEGWGLYAERLAKEMGAYKDPYRVRQAFE